MKLKQILKLGKLVRKGLKNFYLYSDDGKIYDVIKNNIGLYYIVEPGLFI